MSLEDKINEFLKSANGRKSVTAAKISAIKGGKSFGQAGGTVISKVSAQEAAETMRDILLKFLAQIGLGTIQTDGIIIGKPQVDADGNISIGLWFDEEAIFRPSLNPEKYPEGVPNIVLNFTHGWYARGAVQGYWESAKRMTWSRSYFAGDAFMQQAVDTFNELKLGVAELNEQYKT